MSKIHLLSKYEEQHHSTVGRVPRPGAQQVTQLLKQARLYKTKIIATLDSYYESHMGSIYEQGVSKTKITRLHNFPEQAFLPGECRIFERGWLYT